MPLHPMHGPRALALLALALCAGCATTPPPASVPAAPPPLDIGHRGASGLAPEHTLAAYDRALELGADYIEQDLQMTRDGVLVVMHDATLDRTARGPRESCTGPVIEKTLAQIRGCDVGSWFNERFPEHARPEYVGLRIPTLEEVFQRYGRDVNYYIETKNPEDAPGMEAELVRLLDRYRLRPPAGRPFQVLVQSFSAAGLRRVHELAPELPLVQLVEGRESSASIRGRLDEVATYAVGIGPAHTSVDSALVREAHARCLAVHPYTVNEPERMREMLDAGVDGMFTNFPDRLEALRGEEAGRGGRAVRLAAESSARCRATR